MAYSWYVWNLLSMRPDGRVMSLGELTFEMDQGCTGGGLTFQTCKEYAVSHHLQHSDAHLESSR
ncbi:hypothetical protein PSCICF_23590 [Pseudomonas cichorii]|nr:hypothetical protein PSCICF_23590 [Pseudomonas cichorii]